VSDELRPIPARTPPLSLDRLDQLILEAMQRNNQLSHREIGEQVGLSASAVRRRIGLLRSGGAISADVAIVDPRVCAPSITVIVMVVFERETRGAYSAFRDTMRDAREVTQCYATLGAYDFALVVQAGSPEAYEAWAESKLMANPSIRRYDSFVVSSRTKFTTQMNIVASQDLAV
jgi:Lrp/AsnC family transcriptional regulator, leucine-responsive regulatory protein